MRDYGECICNIKQKLADAWNMANEAIKKVKVNGTVYSPDGTGTVDLGTIETEIPTASEVPSTDGNVQTDIDGIKASVTANATAIATETTERTDADETLQANIDAVGSTAASNASAIATESTTRADADSALQSAVDTLTTNLATETTERTDADDVLKNDLDLLSVEVAKKQNITMSDGRTVENAIGALDDEVGSETDAGTILNRIAKNETAISDETTARRNEDTALASDIADNATAIANEVTARTEADNTLQTAIDEINGSISTNASNIASNKTEIDANAAAIAGKQDALTAGDGIAIADNVISSTVDVSGIATNASAISDLQTAVAGKQDMLSAGDGISIAENVVSNSGVTSIVAGDNITIDNSTGAVTINAESGGTEYTAGNGISISDNIISTSLFTGGGLSYSASTKQLMLTGISSGYNYTQQITIDANSSVVALGGYDYGCVNSANILTKSQDDLTGLTYEVRPYGSSYNARYILYLINHTDNSITLTLKLTAYVGYDVRTGNYPTFIPELESEFEYQQGLINAQKQDILTTVTEISENDTLDTSVLCTTEFNVGDRLIMGGFDGIITTGGTSWVAYGGGISGYIKVSSNGSSMLTYVATNGNSSMGSGTFINTPTFRISA